ncbi:hypothetical protein E4K67_10550 [Desulfosporosinus fructosivorans]|uniref:Uncharacterized protein n=1 Tax=Desulfosporosinus fructosivorans TaxID=2018669 RepID=A0A4Z0R5R8_9FIRM|nr:hypothetical protein [Desulfosporosinus fructosivorans]TGE38382.1 hypothetical protein E4K67_10550 [Desulfosporosinus fructosivorans]
MIKRIFELLQNAPVSTPNSFIYPFWRLSWSLFIHMTVICTRNYKSDKENLASAKPSVAGGRLNCTDALAMDGRVSL